MTEGPIFDVVCRAISDDSRHRILRGHKFRCFDSQIDPSGQCFATASEDGTVKIWHLASGQPMAVLEHSASEVRTMFKGVWTHTPCFNPLSASFFVSL
ncbi:unnamed protein product [Heterosigma akashiwo]